MNYWYDRHSQSHIDSMIMWKSNKIFVMCKNDKERFKLKVLLQSKGVVWNDDKMLPLYHKYDMGRFTYSYYCIHNSKMSYLKMSPIKAFLNKMDRTYTFYYVLRDAIGISEFYNNYFKNKFTNPNNRPNIIID